MPICRHAKLFLRPWAPFIKTCNNSTRRPTDHSTLRFGVASTDQELASSSPPNHYRGFQPGHSTKPSSLLAPRFWHSNAERVFPWSCELLTSVRYRRLRADDGFIGHSRGQLRSIQLMRSSFRTPCPEDYATVGAIIEAAMMTCLHHMAWEKGRDTHKLQHLYPSPGRRLESLQDCHRSCGHECQESS